MEKFKNYFKFPLKMWDDFYIKVFTDDDKMAFDWLVNIPDNIKFKILDIINGNESVSFKVPKVFRHEAGIIYCKFLGGSDEGKEIKFLRIRGWGMLTGTGGYHLDDNEAADIQDTFAEYIVEKLNGNNNE